MSDRDRTDYLLEYKKAKYKRIPLDVKLEDYARLQEAAAGKNETVNGYIKKAIAMRMETDK